MGVGELMNPERIDEEPLAQVFCASSQQKWKYGIHSFKMTSKKWNSMYNAHANLHIAGYIMC